MARKFAVLQRIDNDRTITLETDYSFLYQLQSALLLALWQQGRLSPMEHRRAQEGLQRQRREQSGQEGL